MRTHTPTRTLAAAVAAAALGSAGLLGAPAHAAGGAPTACDFPVYSGGKIGTVSCAMGGAARFTPALTSPVVATTGTTLQHPYYKNGELWGFSGQLLLDAKGRAAYVQTIDDGNPYWVKPIQGTAPLRAVTAGSATNMDWDAAPLVTSVLYGITTKGDLVRMPVTWKGNLPVIGRQTRIAKGVGDLVDIEMAWWQGRDFVPSEDNLLGITKSGTFVELQVTRGTRPSVKRHVVGSAGVKNVVGLGENRGYWADDTMAWLVRTSDGTVRQFLDPKFADRSMRGIKAQKLTVVPRSMTLL